MRLKGMGLVPVATAGMIVVSALVGSGSSVSIFTGGRSENDRRPAILALGRAEPAHGPALCCA
jgi:hypothetical protein